MEKKNKIVPCCLRSEQTLPSMEQMQATAGRVRPGFKILRSLAVTTLLISSAGTALAEEKKLELDEVSVTATRMERKTSEVTASVTVINTAAIEDTKQFNVKEVLTGTPGVLIESGNQGYDSRLIIRGAGLKAPYGVREIMVLRDGVPVTDPDSFTRLDMIDTQLIDRVEVVKGPNSTMWGANAAGGVINIISKNPLERTGGSIRVSGGEQETRSYHLSYADNVSSKLYYGASVSHRESDNSWRRWNDFSTTQVSLQPYLLLDDGTVWENTLSYSKADLQLPGSLNEAQFNDYLESGEAKVTDGAWQYSGRYSNSYFFSSKLTKEFGDFELIPMIYYNVWDHHHPVTGRINDADTALGGVDVQLNYHHEVRGMKGTLTGGLTGRHDSQDTDYYQYASFSTVPGPSGRIKEVLSDQTGRLLEVQSKNTMLWGLYAQESLRPTEATILDLGLRYDRIDFDIKSTGWGDYNWATGKYDIFAAEVTSNVEKKYDALSPRIGLSYALSEILHTFVSASTGVQTPTESEISDNPALELVKVQSYEVGLKGRSEKWTFDTALYYSPVKNEVVKVVQGAITEYVNAGKTEKKGLELSGNLEVLTGLTLGAGYSYTDYTFDEFSEPVGRPAVKTNRDGNQLPFVPEHQYSLSANYHHPSGFKSSIQALSWGEYYMDNANTEKYDGYEFVTNLMCGFVKGKFDVALNIENLFDQQYASEVTKDTTLVKKYTPAAPRTITARVNFMF